MSVLPSDIVVYGSADMPETDGATIGGAVDFTRRVIYYVGPVDPVRDEVVGPAGPTTSTRMARRTTRPSVTRSVRSSTRACSSRSRQTGPR